MRVQKQTPWLCAGCPIRIQREISCQRAWFLRDCVEVVSRCKHGGSEAGRRSKPSVAFALGTILLFIGICPQPDIMVEYLRWEPLDHVAGAGVGFEQRNASSESLEDDEPS